jgi:hypothetical protein
MFSPLEIDDGPADDFRCMNTCLNQNAGQIPSRNSLFERVQRDFSASVMPLRKRPAADAAAGS